MSAAGDGVQVLPVRGIGDVTPGDDLAKLITSAAPWLRDGDILVVTSKIVSKAEGRLVEVPADGPERADARERALAAETVRTVARRGSTAIVQTRHGFVMAAAGIDASNVDKTHLVLLPLDPDASARALRADLRSRYGLDVAVIVSDTMGRAWRHGLTDVALGAAGVAPIRDHRGETDPYGNELELTEMAVVDELAAAGELVKGKCDRVPVAVVRGYLPATGDDGRGAAALVRPPADDMFTLGTAEARAAGLLDAALLDDPAQLPGGPTDPVRLARALSRVADAVAPGTTFTVLTPPTLSATSQIPAPGRDAAPDLDATPDPELDESQVVPGTTALVRCTPAVDATLDAAALLRLGSDVHRLRAALAGEHLHSTITTPIPTSHVLIAISGTKREILQSCGATDATTRQDPGRAG
ncbi:MAG TPA: coenzyme F420-0:L-glutamate ligase [Actinoplanes sp.]|nr:coenzyme F420-0:L-glutamate ligase [Actinoplanes sp.]